MGVTVAPFIGIARELYQLAHGRNPQFAADHLIHWLLTKAAAAEPGKIASGSVALAMGLTVARQVLSIDPEADHDLVRPHKYSMFSVVYYGARGQN